MRKVVIAALAVALIGLGAAVAPHGEAASAAEVVYDITLKRGRSQTTFGDAFPFTGKGTLTVDDVTGEFEYEIELSNGLTFSGSGVAASTTKGELFATSTTMSDGIEGVLIFTGKLKKNGARIKAGKLAVAVPNRLGPPPAGFVYSTAKITGKRQ